jgi:predicted DNA-binding transcriptional regulator AlpA
MTAEFVTTFEEIFPKKAFLTLADVTEVLQCEEQVIYNWSKRADPRKRPPRIIVGREIRFPKKEFAKWLAHEQGIGMAA